MRDDKFPFRPLPPPPPVSLRYRHPPSIHIDWSKVEPARSEPYDVPTANRALAIGLAGLLVTWTVALFLAAL